MEKLLFGKTPLIKQDDGSYLFRLTLDLKLTERELDLTERGLKEYLEHELIVQVNDKIGNL